MSFALRRRSKHQLGCPIDCRRCPATLASAEQCPGLADQLFYGVQAGDLRRSGGRERRLPCAEESPPLPPARLSTTDPYPRWSGRNKSERGSVPVGFRTGCSDSGSVKICNSKVTAATRCEPARRRSGPLLGVPNPSDVGAGAGSFTAAQETPEESDRCPSTHPYPATNTFALRNSQPCWRSTAARFGDGFMTAICRARCSWDRTPSPGIPARSTPGLRSARGRRKIVVRDRSGGRSLAALAWQTA